MTCVVCVLMARLHYKRHSGGQRLTLQKALLRDAQVPTLSDLLDIFDDKRRSNTLIKRIAADNEARNPRRILLRMTNDK